jgi:hypothetical protein
MKLVGMSLVKNFSPEDQVFYVGIKYSKHGSMKVRPLGVKIGPFDYIPLTKKKKPRRSSCEAAQSWTLLESCDSFFKRKTIITEHPQLISHFLSAG